ncbi:NAD-dependent epimerase/dehydratase family protein [Halobacteria archaeon AArc-m2/3/4]|uniref:NAD-dependent epimerase/dehydratase family protein n=1 Tax=Natronoglomus mannanivorans TaxID=2979990 RepID=A0ABT2QKA7_9EURY|nr:NAD-dependent epimerase/dehydratase family protein [Halobacteria archaeon AArc-m2/3/4]
MLDQFAGTSVLVTGGAGFIGGKLVETLVPVADVTVLDDCSGGDPESVPSEATFVQGDIRDRETVSDAMEGIDVVFHEAALVSVSRSVEDPLESHTRNATGTLTVLEAARDHDARVVCASSAAIYGQPDTVPISETDPTRPTSPYGLDKLALDEYTRLYHELYGLETVALRYFNVYGPGQPANDYSGVISIFFDRARAGEPLTVFGDGEQTRDFVFIDDVVQANLRAAVTDEVGEAYNIGTGTRVTITELAESVLEVTGSRSEIVYDDPREGDIRHSGADISKAREMLGFEPSVSLEGGLSRFVE